MALGMLILLGVGTLYLSANQSTRVVANRGSAEETGQIALSLIGASVRRAGYSEIVGREDPTNLRQNLIYSGPTLRACRNARFTALSDTNFACAAAVADAPDSIAVWYQADNVIATSQGPITDCLGFAAPTQAVLNAALAPRAPGGQIPVARNEFYVANGQLRCRNNSATPVDQPLLDGVEDLKVFFGFDDAGYAANRHDGLRPNATSLRTATEINALAAPLLANATAWDFVVNVHVCVLVRSAEVGITTEASAAYIPCPQTAAEALNPSSIGAITVTDGILRRAVNRVFAVRARTAPLPVE
jgi:hypothetical protein